MPEGRARVLVIEDDPLNVELFRRALASDGHEVVIERDGSSALARAMSEEFDVILCDIHLPGMDGYAILRELRAAGRRGPILALSASARSDQVDRGVSAGFDEYLTKPISPAALRSAVRRAANLA